MGNISPEDDFPGRLLHQVSLLQALYVNVIFNTLLQGKFF
jgi:hypothetical protein